LRAKETWKDTLQDRQVRSPGIVSVLVERGYHDLSGI
jgi:hypothetical protein